MPRKTCPYNLQGGSTYKLIFLGLPTPTDFSRNRTWLLTLCAVGAPAESAFCTFPTPFFFSLFCLGKDLCMQCNCNLISVDKKKKKKKKTVPHTHTSLLIPRQPSLLLLFVSTFVWLTSSQHSLFYQRPMVTNSSKKKKKQATIV